MMLIQNNKGDHYAAIKKKCYLEKPIPSQVVTATVLSKPKGLMSVATKVAIQMNAKLGGEPWAELLASQEDEAATIEVSLARGMKCERCWHYEGDIGQHTDHPKLCGRCVDVLKRCSYQKS